MILRRSCNCRTGEEAEIAEEGPPLGVGSVPSYRCLWIVGSVTVVRAGHLDGIKTVSILKIFYLHVHVYQPSLISPFAAGDLPSNMGGYRGSPNIQLKDAVVDAIKAKRRQPLRHLNPSSSQFCPPDSIVGTE